MWPRRTCSSDSWWVGVTPAQLHRCRALLNLEMSPISATKIEASTGPTPGMACDGLVAEVAGEVRSDLSFSTMVDLTVDELDQVAEAFDPDAVGIGQGHLV